jgi:hypothetical protein
MMPSLKAHVRKGRLVLDEPTELADEEREQVVASLRARASSR